MNLPAIGATGYLLESLSESGYAVIAGVAYPAKSQTEELTASQCIVVTGYEDGHVLVRVATEAEAKQAAQAESARAAVQAGGVAEPQVSIKSILFTIAGAIVAGFTVPLAHLFTFDMLLGSGLLPNGLIVILLLGLPWIYAAAVGLVINKLFKSRGAAILIAVVGLLSCLPTIIWIGLLMLSRGEAIGR